MNQRLMIALAKVVDDRPSSKETNMTKDPRYEDYKELYLHGDCATFALALQKVFGYPVSLALYYGDYPPDEQEKEEGTLIHAVGIKGSTSIDFRGKHNTSLKKIALDYFEEEYSNLGEAASPDLIFIENDYTATEIRKQFRVGKKEFMDAVDWIKTYQNYYN